MVAGQRFDLDEAREKARQAKQQAKMKALISNVVLGVVVLLLALGAWFGWTKWQEKRERAREAAEAEEQAELARQQKERKKQEAERKAREEKRKREIREREEARQREREEREEARRRQNEARERERFEREEARRREAEHREQQKEFKAYADSAVKGIKFDLDSHVICELETEHMVDFSVEEERWSDLAGSVSSPIAFLTLLKESKTNPYDADFSEANYPSIKVVADLLENLKEEKFTLVATLVPDAVKSGEYAFLAVNPDTGLDVPKGVVEAKDKKKTTGWSIPFVYSDTQPYYFMTWKTANALRRDWMQFVKKVEKDASKLKNRDGYIRDKINEAYPIFVETVKKTLTTPPPEPEKPKVEEKPAERKPKATLKGGGMNNNNNNNRGSKGLINNRTFSTGASTRR